MTSGQRDFLAYINGRVVPYSEAAPILQRINARSAGGYYDTARTFGGKTFRLRQHIERLFNGLTYSNIDTGLSIEDMETISIGLVGTNHSLIEGENHEMTVTQTVTVSRPEAADDLPGVDVAIYCSLLDVSAFARSYVEGVRIYTPNTYPEPQGQSAGDGKTGAVQVLPLMSNARGHITECRGANFMFVSDGRIKLPDRSNVLPGVSMHTVLEIADYLGIGVDEGLYNQRELYDADEAFVSSTRYCLLPVASINGYPLGDSVPGSLTESLLSRWKEIVGVDFVERALDSLSGE
ncbi:MAG: aminotransferase class IV [Dehalococcoidia bacterium]|nr:aminotransferase class IV [Dehalococcoidia bacterium]